MKTKEKWELLSERKKKELNGGQERGKGELRKETVCVLKCERVQWPSAGWCV